MKRNDGFTLVELLVAIIVAGLASAAVFTLLLMGIRIYGRSTALAVQQNNAQMVLEVMGNVISEEATAVEGNAVLAEEDILVAYEGGSVKIRGTALLKADSFYAYPEGSLVHITVTIDGETYDSSHYCRLMAETEPNPSEGDGDIQTAFALRDYEEVLAFAVEDGENPEGVTQFLSVLASQYGSRGQILNEAGEATGEYYSQWYIGGYEDNPGWDAETPWCACYLSWAMAQCDGLESVPRYANVDTFWVDLVTEQNWGSLPAVGDIIFFD